MKRFLSVLVLMLALLFVLGGSTLWAEETFDYVQSVGIYYDCRYSTSDYDADTRFDPMPGEVIRLDAWFKQNVHLDDVNWVRFKNNTNRNTYLTHDASVTPIWSCPPDYDCGPGYEILLPVDISIITGEWKVDIKYNREGLVPVKKETFELKASPADFSDAPPPVQGDSVTVNGDGTVTVEWDATLGAPCDPCIGGEDDVCDNPTCTRVTGYYVRVYDATGSVIVYSQKVIGCSWDNGVYVPGYPGSVSFTIPAEYRGRKFRMEQRWHCVGGVASGDPPFLVSRSSLYDILP